jgi:hypothetical protein
MAHIGLDGCDNAGRYTVLQIKDIEKLSIELVGPNMLAGLALDELPSDSHPASRLANAAFEDVAHPQVAPHLLYLHGTAFINERRVSGDDEEPFYPRERRDDVFYDSVREVVCSGSPLIFWNGKTAIEGLSGSVSNSRTSTLRFD